MCASTLLAGEAHACTEGRKCYVQTTDFQYAILCAPFVGARCACSNSLTEAAQWVPRIHACRSAVAAGVLLCVRQAGGAGVHPDRRAGGVPCICVRIHALQWHAPVAAVWPAHIQGAGVETEVCQS